MYPCLFRLYLLINSQSLHDYPYIALSDASDWIISICDEHIYIDSRRRTAIDLEADYIATSRVIPIDISLILSLVDMFAGTDDCSITARFREDKHVTLTHHLPHLNRCVDYDLYDDGASLTAEIVVTRLLPIMEQIRAAARNLED